MDDVINESAKPAYEFVHIIITQCVCVIIILLGIICIKYFFKGTYRNVKTFYEQSICADTDITQVLPEEFTVKASD